MSLTAIISLLTEIQHTQQILLEQTANFEKRLYIIEDGVNSIKHGRKTHGATRRIRIKEQPKEHNQLRTFDIINIRLCQLSLKHIEIIFFSSLEFAFCIVLLETLFKLCDLKKSCTQFVYAETAHCDNHYHIDVKAQLQRIRSWFDDNPDYKSVVPFKKQPNIDVDIRRQRNISIPLLGYYNEQWCSSSYKSKIMTMYDMFSIKVIQQFGEWQDEHADAIERNSLPRNLDYTECVLKIMGHPDDMNTMSKSVDIICDYLGQIC